MWQLDRLCKLLILPLSFIIGPYIFQYTFVCRSRHPTSTYIRLNDLSHHDLQNIYFKTFFWFKCTPLPFVLPKPMPFLRGATKKNITEPQPQRCAKNGKEWMQLMSASPRGDRFRNEARTKAQLLWLRQQRPGTTWWNQTLEIFQQLEEPSICFLFVSTV